jgi:hypothetical protein
VRGFVCELRRYPDQDGCLILLCNRDDVPVSAVAAALEAILFGEPLPGPEPPRSLDGPLAQALSGRYDDANGATLLVQADGKVNRVQIHWSPPRGPVTRAVLGLDARGDVVLFEWSAVTKISLDRQSNQAVSRVSFLNRQFRRAR